MDGGGTTFTNEEEDCGIRMTVVFGVCRWRSSRFGLPLGKYVNLSMIPSATATPPKRRLDLAE